MVYKFLSFSNFLNSTNFTLNSFNGSTRTKTKGTVNYFIAMNAQPAQQQGEIKFHNYLVSFISFGTINAKIKIKEERMKYLSQVLFWAGIVSSYIVLLFYNIYFITCLRKWLKDSLA